MRYRSSHNGQPFNSINAGRRFFLPIDVSGCIFWVRGDLGVSQSGNSVSAWNDQSLRNNHLFSYVNPTYVSNAVNNRPGISFNGTSQGMYAIDSSSLDLNIVTCIVVHSGYGTSTGNPAGLVAKRGSTGTNYQFFGNGNQFNGSVYTGPNDTDSAWKIRYFQQRPYFLGLNTFFSFKNGTQLFGSTDVIGAQNNEVMWVGMSSIGEYLSGTIAEIIMYNKLLQNAERNRLYRYLGLRYNISVTLA